MGKSNFMARQFNMKNYVLVFIMYYFFSRENINELRDGHVKDGLKGVLSKING